MYTETGGPDPSYALRFWLLGASGTRPTPLSLKERTAHLAAVGIKQD